MTTFQSIGDVTANLVSGLSRDRIWDGSQITSPGVYSGVPMSEYHRNTALFDGWSMSSSGLRRVLERPLEYWMGSPFNPNAEPDEPTDAMIFGRAAHALLLGDEAFSDSFVMRPEMLDDKAWSGQRTVCKEWLAKQTKDVITKEQLERIEQMAEAIRRHPFAAGMLSGRVERTMCIKAGSIWIKARPDCIPSDDGIFADLKTAANVSDDGINRSIGDAGYHVQAALIRMIATSLGMPFTDFGFIFVEKSAPFDVRVKLMKPHDLDRGQLLVEQACRITERCIKEGNWPGYDGFGNAEGYAEVPVYAAKREELTIEAAKAERKAA
jgi:hypothetical protein